MTCIEIVLTKKEETVLNFKTYYVVHYLIVVVLSSFFIGATSRKLGIGNLLPGIF
jgi:hypothetical protein